MVEYSYEVIVILLTEERRYRVLKEQAGKTLSGLAGLFFGAWTPGAGKIRASG
jgi:hypothetical protein